MTLKIINITYDASVESRVYPAGVLSIDTKTNALHIHDGFTPNGVALPTTSTLSAYAKTDMSNVSQTDVNNLLTKYGALSMNNTVPPTDQQRDIALTKLNLNINKSTLTVPEHNFVTVNKDTKIASNVDMTTQPIYVGIDTAGTVTDRIGNTEYTADRDCVVVLKYSIFSERDGAPVARFTFLLNDIEMEAVDQHSWAGHTRTNVFRINIAKGQRYKAFTAGNATSILSYKEYGQLHSYRSN